MPQITAQIKGRSIALSLPRRWITDLMHFCRGIPLIPIEREMNLSELVSRRESLPIRPSWCAIFTKALGIVAQRRPELRRFYQSLWFPRLYEHPWSVAAIAIEREFQGEPAVFFALVHAPEKQPLTNFDEHLRYFKEAPIHEVSTYRRLIRNTKYPWPLRKWLWYLMMNWSGLGRVKNIGTFGVSVTAGQGAGTLSLISPQTSTLHYSPFDDRGNIAVRITFDHRVVDGAFMARALTDLEYVLKNEIMNELNDLAVSQHTSFSEVPQILHTRSLTSSKKAC
jgi:hypothetical protein